MRTYLPILFMLFTLSCNKDNCSYLEVNILFSNETDKDWTLSGGFEGCDEQYYDFEFLIESGLSIGTITESSLVEPSSVLLEVYVRDEFGVIVPNGILNEDINPKEN